MRSTKLTALILSTGLMVACGGKSETPVEEDKGSTGTGGDSSTTEKEEEEEGETGGAGGVSTGTEEEESEKPAPAAPCDDDPCVNGTCTEDGDSYSCSCDAGYMGDTCEDVVKACEDNPCENGACTDLDGGEYECSCDAGYDGANCDNDIDDCAANPCQNGTCLDLVDDYSCTCDEGWTGSECDVCDAGYYSDNGQCLADPLAQICTGKSVNGTDDWASYGSTSLHRVTDTSSCGFAETPLYFANVSGTSNHFGLRGVSSIYSPSATGFETYVAYTQALEPAYAQERDWQINWVAVPNGITGDRLCTGTSGQTSTTWVQYGTDGIYTDVDTSACGFNATPRIFTSLGGDNNHWVSLGATSVYHATATGFRVYLFRGGVTVDYATERNWHVNFMALDPTVSSEYVCTGATTDGATDFTAYGTRSVYVDVDTSACGHSEVPVTLTSIGGQRDHWLSRGANASYNLTATGFRTYITDTFGERSPEEANADGWHLNWLSF